MTNDKLYTVCSAYGRSECPDDREVIEVDGAAQWPVNAHSLRQVIYWTREEDAAEVARMLGAHRPDALVYVSKHDAAADYIERHGSPIRTSRGPVGALAGAL